MNKYMNTPFTAFCAFKGGNYYGNEWDGTHNGEPLPSVVVIVNSSEPLPAVVVNVSREARKRDAGAQEGAIAPS